MVLPEEAMLEAPKPPFPKAGLLLNAALSHTKLLLLLLGLRMNSKAPVPKAGRLLLLVVLLLAAVLPQMPPTPVNNSRTGA